MRSTLLALAALALPPAAQERVVFLVGEEEYGSARTMAALADELAEEGLDVDLRVARGRELPPVPAADEADLLVLYLRFREVTDEEVARLGAWLDAGKPAVALRTTSHLFVDEERMGWFPPRFGGHYKAHAPNDEGTVVVVAANAVDHPALVGVPGALELEDGGTYDAQPLADGAEVLLFGRTGDLPAQPVAWTYSTRPGQRLVYTSLGAEENFEHAGFRRFLRNAVRWCLSDEADADAAARPTPPPPPPSTAPDGATHLFDGGDLEAWRHWDPSVEPRAIEIDARADTSAGGPRYAFPRWRVEDGTLVARPGFGDLLTTQEFADYHLHLDVWVPREPDNLPPDFLGTSGVYLSGRYEAPIVNYHAGVWHAVDVAFEHRAGAEPHASYWIDGRRVWDDRALERGPYGFLAPVPGEEGGDGARPWHVERDHGTDWSEEFSIVADFRTRRSGTLLSLCPPEGDWAPDAKALFLRGGRLVYDIGWVGALTSEDRWNDGEWHRVVLTSDHGVAQLFVDGDPQAERDEFDAEDDEDFVVKVGAANPNFAFTYEGELGRVAWFDVAFDEEEAVAISDGADPEAEPGFAWEPDGDAPAPAGPPPAPGDSIPGPIRLQADASEVRFANVWVAPLGDVDHASLIESWDDEAFARGAQTWAGLCVTCHGSDGSKPPNPQARAFAEAPLENGADPFSLYRTVRHGFREMPSNAWLSPEQTYDVVHYLREEFLRPKNPEQLVEVTDAYLASLPKGRRHGPAEEADELLPRDWGAALGAQLGPDVGAGLAIPLSEDVTLGYDLQTMQSAGAWTDGFLQLASTHHYQQRGEGIARPDGDPMPGMDGWGWGYGGTLDWDRALRPDRGPLPRAMLDYRGYHVHGRDLVLTYRVDGREVLEQPLVDRSSGLPVLEHRLWIGPGDAALVLGLTRAPDGPLHASTTYDDLEDPLGRPVYGHAFEPPTEDDPFAAVAVFGADRLEVEDGRSFLRIPPSNEARELVVLRTGRPWADELEGFLLYTANRAEQPLPPSPRALLGGGEPRWPVELVTEGELGGEGGAYALDTLTLPEDNPWNAWIRTSALDFFEDGRAAVSTHGGDVWIVSGVDDDLGELRWRRFAAGLFEPMGVRVVDGLVYVTCRDRVVRLHDRNGDGEADFYESFFPDTDVSATFHAYNFDLQTDAAGNLYYAKSGQYTRFDKGGAIVKVTPDGREWEYYALGLRTPNGMGMTPEGRPTVSDNQGNWIPASKVTIARHGGFYGVFPAINVGGAGEQTRDTFDPPVIWMPQSFDSSSGGQVWVDDPRWGPLSGRLVHSSFGKGWIYPMTVRSVGDVEQAAIWRMPFQFGAGLQRLRVNPVDGQVYGVGLSGWQGPSGGADGAFQRVRHTGNDVPLLLDAEATATGVRLTFTHALHPDSADLGAVRAKRWNYRWARRYGSAHWSVERPDREGEDTLDVERVHVGGDGRTLEVELAPWGPADQVEVRVDVRAADGTRLEELVYFTVHALPGR